MWYLRDKDIRDLLPTPMLKKYEALQVALVAAAGCGVYMCRKAGCCFAAVMEKGDGPRFTCAVCHDSYCVR